MLPFLYDYKNEWVFYTLKKIIFQNVYSYSISQLEHYIFIVNIDLC